jgi:uncharacterized protein with PQ loop repeat
MENFVEIQNWGFNALIISALLTVVFTVFQGYGFIRQSQKIWKKKSAESLSAPFFFLLFFYFIAFTFYGFSKNSLAIIFNSLLFLPCAPIVIGIIRFKKLTRFDIASLILTVPIVPIMILTKEKDVFLLILLIISLAILVTQPFEMLKAKSRGSVEIWFVIIFLATSVFWFIYSSVSGNWALQLFNFCAIIVYSLIIFLYARYKT